MIDIYTIRTCFLKMFYSIYEFISDFNFYNIKTKIIAFIARIINWFNNFYTLNEIYSFDIKDNTINKSYYPKLYFNVLYTCYNFTILYPLYYILFMINPILSKIYILNVRYNNHNYKLIVDNKINDNIDMIFKYQDYILTKEIFDMKCIDLKCSNDPLNTNFKTFNINQYVFNNMYQTIKYIIMDINSDIIITNYVLPISVEITDLIDDTEKITFDINNQMLNLNVSTICEQYILSNSLNN